MKEQANISLQKTDSKTSETTAAIGIHLLFALAGFAAAKATVSGGLSPFGISLLASVPQSFVPAAAIGVFLGYFLSALSGGGFRYVAALFAILSIRILVSGYKKTAESVPFLCLICFLSDFFTAAVAFRAAPDAVLKVLTESILCTAGAYFFLRCFRVVQNATAGIVAEELCFLFFGLCIPVMGLATVRFSGISLGHILGFLLLLTASKYGGIISGALGGIMLSFAMLLCDESALFAVLFALSGLFCGLFSPFGKYVQILPALLLTSVTVLPRGTADAAAGIVEFLLGAVLFLLLPRQAGIAAGRFLAPFPKMATLPSVKKTVSMRLDAASDALSDISQTVEQVAGELAKINTPDFGTVITRIEQDACTGCKLRLHCWENRKSETTAAVLAITKAVKKGAKSPEEGAPTDFAGRCLRLPQVAAAAKRHFSDYLSRVEAEHRIAEVRNVVSDQFDGISVMLSELSRDLENDLRFDHALAEKATAALQTLGIQTEECNCRIDHHGRATVELKIKKEPDTVLNKLQIMKIASLACERDFGPPPVSGVGENLYLTLNEYPAIRVDIGVEQKCAAPSGMCGDAYRYFTDKGRFVMILSDGMGTGAEAAADAEATAEIFASLVEADLSFSCALRTVNEAMLLREDTESVSALDAVQIDLFSGDTVFYKAGAAASYVLHKGKVDRVETPCMPVGILPDAAFRETKRTLHAGDVIVLVSDGTCGMRDDHVVAALTAFRGGSAQRLAEDVLARARAANKMHADDSTVLAVVAESG